MAPHSSVFAWRIPGTGEPDAVYGVAQSRTRLKRLSSSSSKPSFFWFLLHGISLFSGFHVQSVFLTGGVSCRQSKWVLFFFFKSI